MSLLAFNMQQLVFEKAEMYSDEIGEWASQ